MNDSTELATIPKESVLTVFSADNGLDYYMAHIRSEIDSFVPDVTTKKGRDGIASIAFKVAKSKTYLDGLGKELGAFISEFKWPWLHDDHFWHWVYTVDQADVDKAVLSAWRRKSAQP